MLSRAAHPALSSRAFPSPAERVPSGSNWIHEIKHDGFHVVARKHGARVKLYSRPGNDVTWR